MSLTHYGTMFSYYSAKTRAYLCYRRIPFVEVYDAQALGGRVREQIGKLVIPVVETAEGEILQDTTVIIDTLEPRYIERPTFPDDEVLMLVTRIVEFIIDEFWITTAMHSRWNDPQSNLFAATEFGLGIGGSMGLVGDDALNMGLKVAARMQSYLPRLGIADEAGQKAASDYFESCSKVLNTAVDARQFLFGQRPSLIDFCVFTG
ncbi:MAG: glutathione S-transferase domain-containing protein, partial [Gammaproteobacteria bacterium]|nr:glutathione S-transferase domain-containing protein [Gammaproteobacteria bacterium]